MRVICALQGAADKGQIDKNVPWNVAERLWKALWTEDKNTSDESVMQAELDPLLPGGWEKWKYVTSPELSPPSFLSLSCFWIHTDCIDI
jgi:hypothetical protein